MNHPETLVPLGTQETGRKQTKQKHLTENQKDEQDSTKNWKRIQVVAMNIEQDVENDMRNLFILENPLRKLTEKIVLTKKLKQRSNNYLNISKNYPNRKTNRMLNQKLSRLLNDPNCEEEILVGIKTLKK